MYYRWTEKARSFISSYEEIEVGKWCRISYHAMLKKYPQYLRWVRNGYMETKDESNSYHQAFNRKLFILEGQTIALEKNLGNLIKQYENLFPYEWNKYQSLTYQQMRLTDKLSWFLDHLRKVRTDNKDKPSCESI